MQKYKLFFSQFILFLFAVSIFTLPARQVHAEGNQVTPISPNLKNAQYTIVNGYKTFHLTAEEVTREVSSGIFMKAWGYNGSTPGPTIVVRNGDKVRIKVTNDLPVPTSVHWHGLIIPNKMDGVPNIEPSPEIKPGQSFTYEFTIHQVGTYMYHSHFNGSKQEMMGLEGMFISLPKKGDTVNGIQVQDDYTLMTQEFELVNSSQTQNTTNASTNDGNNNTNRNQNPNFNKGNNNQNPNLNNNYPNQVSNPNGGNTNQVPNSTNNQPNFNPSLIPQPIQTIESPFGWGTIPLTPISWCMNRSPSYNLRNQYNSPNNGPTASNNSANNSSLSGNQNTSPYGAGQVPPGQYTVNAKAMQWNMFTFNGKQFPATKPMIIKQGDWVHLRLGNISMQTHPIHFHGHNFIVVGKDGTPIPKSAQYFANTIALAPGETYDLLFRANNPGTWVIHCHLPHHTAGPGQSDGGMLTVFHYQGTPWPPAFTQQ